MSALRTLSFVLRVDALALALALAAVLVIPALARADEAVVSDLAVPLSLEACVKLAQQSTPQQLAERARLLDADGQLKQARTLANPTLSYVAQDLGLQNQGGPLLLHQAQLGFSPLLALLRVQESQAASAGRQRTIAANQDDQRQLKRAVGRAFYDLLLAQQVAAIDAQAVQVAAALLERNSRRQNIGELGALEVLRARAEELEAQRSAQLSARQHLQLQLAFSLLLGAATPQRVRLLDEDVDIASQPPLGLPAELQAALAAEHADASRLLLQRAQNRRPDLQQASAELKQAEELQHLAALRTIPFVDLQLTGGVRVSTAGVGGLVGISAPLPLLDFNQGPRLRAQAQVLAARAAYVRVDRQVRLEIESSYVDWQQTRHSLQQFAQPVVDARAQIVRATQQQLIEGVASVLDVILAQRELLAAQKVRAQVIHDAQVARWQLAVATDTW